MKITIEVEVEPNEVALATDLMATLRAITEHVTAQPPTMRVNGVAHKSGKARPDKAAAIGHVPVMAPGAPGPGSASPVPTAALPPTTMHANPLPPPGVPATAPPMAPPPAGPPPTLPAAAPAGASPPVDLAALIAQITPDPDSLALVADRLVPALAQVGVQQFLDTFEGVVFVTIDPNDQDAMQRITSVVPQFNLLSLIPDPYRADIRSNKGITPRVLKQLTLKRTLHVTRVEFYQYCEAFAWLALNGFVTLDGALKTISKMLEKEETRAAAVTMLGKTVEMCAPLISQHVSAEVVGRLQEALRVKALPELGLFGYDLQYVSQSLGWPAETFPGLEAHLSAQPMQ